MYPLSITKKTICSGLDPLTDSARHVKEGMVAAVGFKILEIKRMAPAERRYQEQQRQASAGPTTTAPLDDGTLDAARGAGGGARRAAPADAGDAALAVPMLEAAPPSGQRANPLA